MTIDLQSLPAPDVVESVDFETLLQQRKDRFVALAPDMADVMGLESEPAVKLLEEASYDEILLRTRVNDAAKAVLLATSTGANLDHLAALYGVTRLVTDPGDSTAIPPIAATYETHDALRARAQMAPEGFSTAGPGGAYRFHASSASGSVLDIAVDSPRFAAIELTAEQRTMLPAGTIALTCTYDAGLDNPFPGMVRITVLSRIGDGTPTADLLSVVNAALNDDDVRPLTDIVVVTAPKILSYALRATLITYPGPSAEAVLESARKEAATYVANTHRLGYDVPLSGLYAALHRPGVQRVMILEPMADIVCGTHEAAHCTAIQLALGGTDV